MTDNKNPVVESFFDIVSSTVSYVVSDPISRAAAVIDPVLDFRAADGRISSASVDRLLDHVRAQKLEVRYVLETHVHADHLSGAQLIKAATGAPVVTGEQVCQVHAMFAPQFFPGMASSICFDHLVTDGEMLPLGGLDIEVLHTPGHTPACVSYRIGDAVFVGDALFMPDFGTARADFPGGDASSLFHSIRRLLSLAPETRMFVGHDYKAADRDAFAWETSVDEQRRANVHVRDGVDEAAFVAVRRARDMTLDPPAQLLASLQVNIRAGRLPPPDADGVVRLRWPLTGWERLGGLI